MQLVTARNASDPAHLGTCSKPATFFGLLDDALRRCGVEARYLPGSYLAGFADGFRSCLGPSMATRPSAICRCPGRSLPLTPTGPSPTSAPDFRFDLEELASNVDFQHGEWEFATKNVDWYEQDTLFFHLT